jgi:MinD superfamily P-loop ATPase
MNIGVLSGKGGTGKTLLSTNMAIAMAGNYIDCDVEEPNGFIFLQPEEIVTEEVSVKNPVVDTDKCTLCGKCVESCNFNALAKIKKIVLFEKLCHSCGACKLVCPEGAISYEKRAVGNKLRTRQAERRRGHGRACDKGCAKISSKGAKHSGLRTWNFLQRGEYA